MYALGKGWPMADPSVKRYYARLFGLAPDRIKLFTQLTTIQKNRVVYLFSSIGVDRFVYAIKADGEMVWSRHKKDTLIERMR